MESKKRPDPFEGIEEDALNTDRGRYSSCGVRIMLSHVLDEHGPESVTSIVRALKNHRLTTSSIHKALESRVEPDFLPSEYTLRRHRRHVCTCPKEDS